MAGKTFTHYNEPYGTVTFTVEVDEPVLYPEDERTPANEYAFLRAEAGWRRVSGTVVEGVEVSRLFQHTARRDLRGRPYSLEVPPHAYEAGEYRTVAM
jgi:hypothetical protein